MKERPGIFAFDIDGTLTQAAHSVPDEVARQLEQLVAEGWSVLFLTGRSAAWAVLPLRELSFPYFLAVQNGAAILEMPLKKVVAHCDLGVGFLKSLDEALGDASLFAVVEGGISREDICYYRKSDSRTSEEDVLLEKRRQMVPVVWEEVKVFSNLAFGNFPLIKVFGTKKEVEKSLKKLAQRGGVNVSCVKDPFSSYHIGMVTAEMANKGRALESLKTFLGGDKVVIAAGDDHNDLPMLQIADLRIVMEGAPLEVRKVADFIVPPARKMGILQGVTLALARLSS